MSRDLSEFLAVVARTAVMFVAIGVRIGADGHPLDSPWQGILVVVCNLVILAASGLGGRMTRIFLDDDR